MKKVKIKFFKTYNAIIAGLIGLLGFSSCDKIGGGDPVVEYGTPSAKFIVNGKVIASDSKEGIENIRVVIPGDTTKTDSEGKYQIHVNGFPEDQKFNIEFQDIDGALNGDFQNLDTVVEFKDPDFTDGDGHWYKGESSKELNIELNNK